MLQPPIEPYDTGWLDVGHGHRIYFEQSGNPDGLPALYVHGGPGSGCTPRQRRFFDPARYRIVLFDQRGCGRSTPLGERAHNHTDALVGDIEALRTHLGIERWLVFGGSWGSTLAAVWAARHRAACSGLILRGVFLAGRSDLDWFFHGAAALAPEAHAALMQAVPARWRTRIVIWLNRALSSGDAARADHAVQAWRDWEDALGNWPDTTPSTPRLEDGCTVLRMALSARYRVQAHYLAHRCFLGEAKVLDAIAHLRGMPVAIVHGSHDLVCRPQNAWRAHQTLSGSRLAWAQGAGHDPFHPASVRLLTAALDAHARDGHFDDWPGAQP
jgi:proline iminopeptidase